MLIPDILYHINNGFSAGLCDFLKKLFDIDAILRQNYNILLRTYYIIK